MQTFGACGGGGVQTHPVHSPWLRACVQVGGLAIEYCRQFQASTPCFTPFSQKLQGSDFKLAGFLVGCWHLMKTLKAKSVFFPLACHESCSVS